VGLIGVINIEEVGLIGVCHIEEVGLIGVSNVRSGFIMVPVLAVGHVLHDTRDQLAHCCVHR
jgi:hypothetical protein